MSCRSKHVAHLLVCLLACATLWLARPACAAAGDDAPAADPSAAAMSVDWQDGTYQIDVSLEGGSGRAGVTSPTRLVVREGKAVVEIEWSSPHYDYMLVDGQRYLPEAREGNSLFVIPLLALDTPVDVVADTTAMSQPHEIAYQLTFDSASVEPVAAAPDAGGGLVYGAAAVVAAGVAGVILWRHRKAIRAQAA